MNAANELAAALAAELRDTGHAWIHDLGEEPDGIYVPAWLVGPDGLRLLVELDRDRAAVHSYPPVAVTCSAPEVRLRAAMSLTKPVPRMAAELVRRLIEPALTALPEALARQEVVDERARERELLVQSLRWRLDAMGNLSQGTVREDIELTAGEYRGPLYVRAAVRSWGAVEFRVSTDFDFAVLLADALEALGVELRARQVAAEPAGGA